jgi:hypothetical protein
MVVRGIEGWTADSEWVDHGYGRWMDQAIKQRRIKGQ